MEEKQLGGLNLVLMTAMKYFKIVVIAAIALIVLSGIYRVESNEAAVVLRFGSLVGATPEEQIKGPGLHFSFPFIIDEVIKIPVGKVQELTITTHCGNGAAISPRIDINGYVITGDSNIVLLKIKAKYTVSDPVSYALFQSDIEKTIDGVISGEVTAIVAGMEVDSVMTTGKAALSERVKSRAQECLGLLGCGVALSSIEFTEVNPPAETRSFFDRVTQAAVEKETMIQTAQKEATVTILDAQALSQTLVQDARSNQSALLSRAYGDAAEFNGLFEQYVHNPDAVRDGVFRLRVSGLLSRMGATVVVPESGSPVVILP